jgi:hypothetical protein
MLSPKLIHSRMHNNNNPSLPANCSEFYTLFSSTATCDNQAKMLLLQAHYSQTSCQYTGEVYTTSANQTTFQKGKTAMKLALEHYSKPVSVAKYRRDAQCAPRISTAISGQKSVHRTLPHPPRPPTPGPAPRPGPLGPPRPPVPTPPPSPRRRHEVKLTLARYTQLRKVWIQLRNTSDSFAGYSHRGSIQSILDSLYSLPRYFDLLTRQHPWLDPLAPTPTETVQEIIQPSDPAPLATGNGLTVDTAEPGPLDRMPNDPSLDYAILPAPRHAAPASDTAQPAVLSAKQVLELGDGPVSCSRGF